MVTKRGQHASNEIPAHFYFRSYFRILFFGVVLKILATLGNLTA